MSAPRPRCAAIMFRSRRGALGQRRHDGDGCEGTASCVAGTCFILCKESSDCLSGECKTYVSPQLSEKIMACTLLDGGTSADVSSSSGGSGGTPTVGAPGSCYDTPICNGHTVKACSTSDGASCYYLVDGSRKVPCASGCSCSAAAQELATSVCR
jgi:hypothetical protein